MKTTSIFAALSLVTLSVAAGCSSAKADEPTGGSTSNLSADECERRSDQCVNRCVGNDGDEASCRETCRPAYDACLGTSDDDSRAPTTRSHTTNDCEAQLSECSNGCARLDESEAADCDTTCQHHYSLCNQSASE